MKSLVAILAFAASRIHGAEFSYDTDHNAAWGSECATSNLYQSPIDLTEATYESMDPITTQYSAEVNVKFANKKHTVQVDTKDHTMWFKGGKSVPVASAKYYWPLQVHFHWGAHDGEGSEHLIGGHQYPFEAHIVHVHSDVNTTAGEHLTTLTASAGGVGPGGLAVIGVMFEIGDPNPQLQKLVDAMSNIATYEADGYTTIDSFDLNGLLPDDLSFYTYEGGLTTPPCSMSVQWHNLATPMTISAAQLAAFRTAKDHEGNSQAPNYRNVQALNGRTIKASSESLVKDLLVAKFQQDYCA